MFSQLKKVALSLMVLASFGLVRAAWAGKTVPFRGHADATVTAFDPQPDGVHVTTVGTGEATHLGRCDREEDLVLNGPAIDGTITFVSKHGDELYAHVTGAFGPEGTASGTYEITGGTGRFANATGNAEWIAVTSDGVHFSITFEGTISY
jgi:hypothetical protein